MAYPFRVVTSEDEIVGKAETIPDAVALMTAFYIRIPTDLYVYDEEGIAHAEMAGSPQRVDSAVPQPLIIEVAEVDPMTFSFHVHGVYEVAQLNFRDGTPEVEVVDETPIDHTFQSAGGYRVLATEGVRSAELLITVTAPAEEPVTAPPEAPSQPK